MTPWISTVPQIQDGITKVSGEDVNPIISALANRTQYLYNRIASTTSKSLLVAYDQPVVAGSGIGKHSIVCFDTAAEGLKLASPLVRLQNSNRSFKPADNSYALGISIDTPTTTADVYIHGVISIKNIVTDLLDAPSSSDAFTINGFNGGPLFLSNISAGKLTANPAGLAIYVGFATDRHNFFLNPSPENLNSFYYNYRFNILDRCAGYPVLANGIWSITALADPVASVGWVNVSDIAETISDLQPVFSNAAGTDTEEPVFYYNIPSDAVIDADASLNDFEKNEAKEVIRAFGPVMPGLHAELHQNGLALPYKETYGDGRSWVLNEAGLWWFSNEDGRQPWDSNINRTIKVGFSNGSPYTFALTDYASSSIVPGDYVRFIEGSMPLDANGTLPTGLTKNDTYKVYSDGSDPASTTLFKLTDNPFTDNGSGTIYLAWQPKYWSFTKGLANSRPQMVLQFSKLAPDLKQAVVTSLTPDTSVGYKSSEAITLLDKTTGELKQTDAVGDLKVRFTLPINNITNALSPTGVRAMSWNGTTGKLDVTTGPSVSNIIGSGGIQVYKNATTGECTVGFSNIQSSLVLSIEPEMADLEMLGLHSFLNLAANKVPCGYVGKFILPDVLPSNTGTNYLQFKLFCFTKSAVNNNSNKIKFKFEYAITKSGILTSATTSNSSIVLTLPTMLTPYTYHLLESTDMKIPVSELAPNAIVNFRINRLAYSSPTPYTGNFCVLGTYWTL